jgi:hypothetical protein
MHAEGILPEWSNQRLSLCSVTKMLAGVVNKSSVVGIALMFMAHPVRAQTVPCASSPLSSDTILPCLKRKNNCALHTQHQLYFALSVKLIERGVTELYNNARTPQT